MTADKILAGIERLLSPKLNEILGEVKAVNTRIDSVESQIASLRNETKSDIARVEERIDSLRNETKIEITSLRTEMIVRLDSLEKRLPVIEELTALKLKIAEIEKKIALA